MNARPSVVEVLHGGDANAQLVGRAFFTRGPRGAVSTTFEYDTEYLRGDGQVIDPAFPLVSGAQHVIGLPGAFADSSPDRWGRNLIDRSERAHAREEQRQPRTLDEVDYLLGVSDNTRQGALRFRVDGKLEGPPSRVPRTISLPHLLRASDEVQSGEDVRGAVQELLDTGSSALGGARPKASVLLDDGGLAIAKLPHASDQWDVMAWEAVALDICAHAGLRVPEYRLVPVGARSVLLLRRFDRDRQGERLGYLSAMSATGARDGEHRDYLDIAEAIRDLSANVAEDLAELWMRVAVSVAIGNTDDHLRNHGFIEERSQWSLSSVFDVNPNPDVGKARATTIVGADSGQDEADGLRALAEECGLVGDAMQARLSVVCDAAAEWEQFAARQGIPLREISVMREGIAPRLESVRETLTHHK